MGLPHFRSGIPQMDNKTGNPRHRTVLKFPACMVMMESILENQCRCIGGYALLTAGETEMLGGGGLDAHGIGVDSHQRGQDLLHGRYVGVEPWALGTDRTVDVAHAPSIGGDDCNRLPKEYLAVDPLKFCACVGEVIADVAHIGGTEEGIANCMDEYVGIAMPQKAMAVGNAYATEPQGTVGDKTMDIEAHTYADCFHCQRIFRTLRKKSLNGDGGGQ